MIGPTDGHACFDRFAITRWKTGFLVATKRIIFLMTCGIVLFEVSAFSLPGRLTKHPRYLSRSHFFGHGISSIRQGFLLELSVDPGSGAPK